MSPTTFVCEKTNGYTHHDQLFKQLIHVFFKEFLEAFFPDVHQHVDFNAIHPLSEEVFTDLYEGESRRADIVIETMLKGTESLLIIHVEPQSYTQQGFHERMYHYFSLLYNKYRKPILPIAVFSYDENHYEPDQFSITFPFLHVLTFNFLKLELRKMNWRSYIKSNNPIAAALISKMGYNEEDKVQVKKEFLIMMTRMELDPARTRMIFGFFERYLTLNEQEEEELMKEIKHTEGMEDIMNLPISWEEKGIEKGIEKEKRNVATEMLNAGLSIELIAEMTKLSIDEIEKMKKTIKDV
jgi:predicted transposase YdaD